MFWVDARIIIHYSSSFIFLEPLANILWYDHHDHTFHFFDDELFGRSIFCRMAAGWRKCSVYVNMSSCWLQNILYRILLAHVGMMTQYKSPISNHNDDRRCLCSCLVSSVVVNAVWHKIFWYFMIQRHWFKYYKYVNESLSTCSAGACLNQALFAYWLIPPHDNCIVYIVITILRQLLS